MVMTRHEGFETLERVKRWPQMMKRFEKVRIFSSEHRAYWLGTGNGYTDDYKQSAVWAFKDAFERTKHCGPEKGIMFVDSDETKGELCPGPRAPSSSTGS